MNYSRGKFKSAQFKKTIPLFITSLQRRVLGSASFGRKPFDRQTFDQHRHLVDTVFHRHSFASFHLVDTPVVTLPANDYSIVGRPNVCRSKGFRWNDGEPRISQKTLLNIVSSVFCLFFCPKCSIYLICNK
jgi:hypothetical protein